jgi:hypothetical protein
LKWRVLIFDTGGFQLPFTPGLLFFAGLKEKQGKERAFFSALPARRSSVSTERRRDRKNSIDLTRLQRRKDRRFANTVFPAGRVQFSISIPPGS